MEIIDRLYSGGNEAYSRVAGKPGWSWLRCCKEDGPDCHRQVVGYKTLAAPHNSEYLAARRGKLMALNLIDVDDPSLIPTELIDKGLAFIHERMQAGDKVMVACNSGMHRGPSMAMAYMRTVGEMPQRFKRAQYIFKTLYPKYDPKDGMTLKLKDMWDELKDKFLKG